MQADGTILIDTSINEDGFEAGTKDLELAVRRMAKSLDGLSDKAKIALQKQTDSFAKLNNQYAQQAKKVDELKKKVAEYENQKLPTEEYKEIQQQIDASQKKLDALIRKQQKFLDLGGSKNSKAYKSMQYDIDELANTIRYANGELDELKESGKAFTFGANTELARKDLEKLAQEEEKLNDMRNRLRTSYQSLEQKVSDYQEEISKSASAQEKASKSAKDLDKSTKRGGMSMAKMLGTSILFSFVFKAISAVMNGVKEGMDNLAQYSGETNATLSSLVSSLTRLKNAFATAFSPILTAVAPALNYLINLLTSAVTAVAQLVAALTGKDTFVRATKVQQNYAESLEGTAGAAEEAEGALASFDRLNVTQDSSGGGAGGGGLSPEDMFETVPVDNALTQALDEIKAKMLELADIFNDGFSVGVGDLSVIDSIKDSISGIKDSLVDIFTSSEVVSAAANMVNTITYDLGRIAGSMASVGLTLADNLIGGIELYLQQNSARIKGYLVSMFNIAGEISTIVANFAVAFAEVFSVFRSDAAKQLTADIIAIFSNSFMGITELISKLFRDVLDLILTPFTDNADAIKEALENTIAPIEEVIGTLADGISTTFDELNQMYDEHIAPMFESFQKGISEIVGSLYDGYNKYISPVLDNLAGKFTKVWEGTIQPLINNAIGLIGDVADLITVVWENVLQPVINWIAEQIFPLIAPALDNIGTEFLTVFEQIGKTLDGFITAARGLVTFLTGVFSGDWQKAWEGIQTTFKGIWDALPGFVKNPLDSIIGSVNKMISAIESGINAIISMVNSISFDIPDWIPIVGGDHFGFDLNEVSLPRIPQLASGTVIPPRAGEFAAILGDNKQETEVVSPLSTMKQAVREVMKEMEGAGGGDIVGYIYLDGRELGQSTVKFVRQEKKRTGRNPILV